MSRHLIDGSGFVETAKSAAAALTNKAEKVNALNVFPVPDGDTGSNMSRTMQSGIAALTRQPSTHLGEAANIFSDGLLLGARGNSGVILSQLFRGFASFLRDRREADAVDLAHALQAGVDTAYKAVVQPVEGTILTVARESAQRAVQYAQSGMELAKWMAAVCKEAAESLERTPDQLPILKKTGVVDSGGQGLVYIYEGMLSALRGQAVTMCSPTETADRHAPGHAQSEALTNVSALSRIQSDEIEFVYDMEFFVRQEQPDKTESSASELRDKLTHIGDSVLVIGSGDKIKVHVHANDPGQVLSLAQSYGEMFSIHIMNMRDQHREASGGSLAQSVPVKQADNVRTTKAIGFVAISPGEGISDIFYSLGVDLVVTGGQTMNPSTEDIVKAIEQVGAERVYVLPNNANILLAAQQAASVSHQQVIVIPTRTIPQGIAAALVCEDGVAPDYLEQKMRDAMEQVKSGAVTKSVRDSRFGELVISEGDYIGLYDDRIVCAGKKIEDVSTSLLQTMVTDEDEIVTVLLGEQSDERMREMMTSVIGSRFPDVELEFHHGGQPLYPMIVSVE